MWVENVSISFIAKRDTELLSSPTDVAAHLLKKLQHPGFVFV